MNRRPRPRWRPRRRQQQPAPAELPTQPSPAALAEIVGLLAGRHYGIANLQLSGDVPETDIIRALLGLCTAVLNELPGDTAPQFLRALGAEVAGKPGP